jgi:hypothetical protein
MNQMTDAQAQWDKACKTLDEEFQLSANELPTIETAKALFLQLVGRREISQEAANALMFSLYFSGFFEAYSQERTKLESFVTQAKSNSSEGLIARAEQTLKLESFPSFVPSNFALRYDQASKILILEHEFPDVGSINWFKLVSLKSGLTVKPANQKEAAALSEGTKGFKIHELLSDGVSKCGAAQTVGLSLCL